MYMLLFAQQGHILYLAAGLLPQHLVRPSIHLDYKGCKSPSLTTGLSGIRTLAPRMGSQPLIHHANPPQLGQGIALATARSSI